MYIDRKRVFDDVYDTFIMISQGRYTSVYDAQTQVTHWCPDAVRMFGLPGEYFDQGAYNWEDCIHPEDVELYRKCMMDLTLGKISSYDLEYRCKFSDGRYLPVHMKGIVIRAENGAPDFIGGLLLEEEVLNKTCPVTGLRNSDGFLDDIEQILKEKKSKNILAIGLKEFGKINDVYGYSYGNKFIRKFASMLTKKCEADAIYRISDIKFAILTEKSREDLIKFIEEINGEMEKGFVVDGIVNQTSTKADVYELNDFDQTPPNVLRSLYDLITLRK
ncbi:MAG: PAS domain-containing protein [Pseudobutyrivibrio sp.]|nr:PAS domain-containing protein [Pseudobutyrivibrio sp.]